MVKSRMATCTIVLLLSFCTLTLTVNQANAIYGWDEHNYIGHSSVIHDSDGGIPPNDYELHYVQWACDDIFWQCFALHSYYRWTYQEEGGYWYYEDLGPAYNRLQSYMQGYRSQTTRENVFSGIDDAEYNHDFATFLMIGHNAYNYMWDRWHYGFIQNGYGINNSLLPAIWDYEIWNHVNPQSNHHFVFLWVCRNGNERGSYDYPLAPNGMPNCWTAGQIGWGNGRPPIGSGYSNPDGTGYCFIGFENYSPMISYPLPGVPANNLCKYWLVFFYATMLNWGYSVREALDQASYWCQYYGGFSGSQLFNGYTTWFPGMDGMSAQWVDGWMRVYGDGNMLVPSDIYEGGP